MQDIRCGSCNRKLGAGEYVRLTIKCPRCGNEYSEGREPLTRRPPSLRYKGLAPCNTLSPLI